jgi:DNA-binding NtrC family response regulator
MLNAEKDGERRHAEAAVGSQGLGPSSAASLSREARLDEAAGRILIVDSDAKFCLLAQRILQSAGHTVEYRHDGDSGLSCLAQMAPDALCLELGRPERSGFEILARVRAHHRLVSVVVVTNDGDFESVVTAVKHGAWDYLAKPIERARLLTVARNAIAHSRMAVRLLNLERESESVECSGIVGSSPPMKALFREIARVASRDIPVLIHGESGTGTELTARAIHDHSARKAEPFIALNCAVVPQSVQESELFGSERGVLNRAAARRAGKAELAHRGTLFLDEIAELSLSAQARLLQVLQERRFTPAGSAGDVAADFRLIAATQRDLLAAVRGGRFREDLYFRIAVFEVEVPPLRERGDDVIELARAALERARKNRGVALELADEAVTLIRQYDWPGNVRELQNAIERAVAIASGEEIQARDLPARLQQRRDSKITPEHGLALPHSADGPGATGLVTAASSEPGPGSLEEVERRAIAHALHETQWRISETVRRLGIGRSTLYRKIKQYNLVP